MLAVFPLPDIPPPAAAPIMNTSASSGHILSHSVPLFLYRASMLLLRTSVVDSDNPSCPASLAVCKAASFNVLLTTSLLFPDKLLKSPLPIFLVVSSKRPSEKLFAYLSFHFP